MREAQRQIKCQKLTTQVKGRRHRLGLEFTIACKWRVFGDHPLKVAAREKGACKNAMAAGALVPVPPDWEPPPVEMTALWRRDSITGHLLKAIVDAFEEALSANPAEVQPPIRGRPVKMVTGLQMPTGSLASPP